MLKHIAFTMYSVKDMKRARRFYEQDLGLEMTKNFDEKWVEYHLENGCFAITTMVPTVKPSMRAGGSIAFEVDDLDAELARLKKLGAAIKAEDIESPVCRMCGGADPEGNAVTLHQKKPGF